MVHTLYFIIIYIPLARTKHIMASETIKTIRNTVIPPIEAAMMMISAVSSDIIPGGTLVDV